MEDDNTVMSKHIQSGELDGDLEPNAASIQLTGRKSPSDLHSSHRAHESTQEDQERAVGITVHVSPEMPGFKCTLKQRYTDFLVNEVLPNGEVLHLTNAGGGGGSTRGQKRQADETLNGPAEREIDTTKTAAKDPSDEGEKETADRDLAPRKKLRVDPSNGDSSSATEGHPGPSVIDTLDSSMSLKDRKLEIISNIPETDKAALQEIFGDAKTNFILDLYASVVIHPERKPRDQPTVKSEIISEKAKRTQAHVAVRRIFSSKLETTTMPEEVGVIAIRAASTKGPSGARGPPMANVANGAYQKGKLGWSELGGEYLHFTLYKENKDTMEVLYFIASQLKVPMKNFQFAGTKDRRGVTVQRVAIYRIHAERIAKLNKMAKGWRVGGFEYQTHGLDLGELTGNEFLITLRDCHLDGGEDAAQEKNFELVKDAVTKATQSFRQRGFLNYYGLQRFGTFSTGTHVIGQKMLRGDLEGAINGILTYPEDLLPENQNGSGTGKVPQDDINRADAIRNWRKTGKSSDAMNTMPKRFQAELAIIQYLGKKDRKTGKLEQDRDWQGALMQIQRNLRLMYVHAYQSFIWNTAAGKRWMLYGNQVVEGDLIIIGEKDETIKGIKDEVDEDGEPVFHPAVDDSAPSAVEDAFTRARPLTKLEAESGKYDAFDIVLPLPGFDVVYPANAIGKFYEEFMASEAGGGMDPHNMRRSWKDISLPGGYRKMMARPGKDLHCEIKAYEGADEQMVETDLETMQKQANKGEVAKYDANGIAERDPVSANQPPGGKGSKIAVLLKLQLGSSQYATMALRELTKGGAVNFKPDYSATR